MENSRNVLRVPDKMYSYGVVNVLIECEFVVGKEREKICKELAVLDLTSRQLLCTTFQPPENLSWNDLPYLCKAHNIHLEEYIHGLKFSEGWLPYKEFENILKKACNFHNSGIFTKGLEKSIFLSKILGKNVQNLEDIPNLYTVNDSDFLNRQKISRSKYVCFHNHLYSRRIHCCLNKVYMQKSKLKKYYKR
jgi:hypothetical protein